MKVHDRLNLLKRYRHTRRLVTSLEQMMETAAAMHSLTLEESAENEALLAADLLVNGPITINGVTYRHEIRDGIDAVGCVSASRQKSLQNPD